MRRFGERRLLYSAKILCGRILEFFKALYYCLNVPLDLDGSPNVSDESIRTD